MTNDEWGSKWPSGPVFPQQLIDQAKREEKEYTDMYGTEVNSVALGVKPNFNKVVNDWLTHTSDVASEASGASGVNWTNQPSSITWDLAKPNSDKTILNKESLQSELKSQGSNLVDNKEYLYFQCEGCNEILDPHTKSFAKLQEHRVNVGWACKWNIDGMGYKVYCAKCEEKV